MTRAISHGARVHLILCKSRFHWATATTGKSKHEQEDAVLIPNRYFLARSRASCVAKHSWNRPTPPAAEICITPWRIRYFQTFLLPHRNAVTGIERQVRIWVFTDHPWGGVPESRLGDPIHQLLPSSVFWTRVHNPWFLFAKGRFPEEDVHILQNRHVLCIHHWYKTWDLWPFRTPWQPPKSVFRLAFPLADLILIA